MQGGVSFLMFHVGAFPTKGCFAKNGRADFAPEMVTHNLAGAQVRVYCDAGVVFGQAPNVEALDFVRVEDASSGSAVSETKVGVAVVALGVASIVLLADGANGPKFYK